MINKMPLTKRNDIKRFKYQLKNKNQPYTNDKDIDFMRVGMVIKAKNGKVYTVINPHILGEEVVEGIVRIDFNLLKDKNNSVNTEWRKYKNPPYKPVGIMCSPKRFDYAKFFGYSKEQCLGDKFEILSVYKQSKRIIYG